MRALGLLAALALLASLAGVVSRPSRGADASGTQARVTLFARPGVVRWAEAALLYGTVRGGQADDVVRIEARECGSRSFRTLVEPHVLPGGGWSTPVLPGVTATFRAVWKRFASAPVTIRQQAWLTLARRRAGGDFLLAAMSKRSLWRRSVLVQRRQGGAWRTVRTVVLADSVRSTGSVSASQATFRLAVPRGTQLRALLPAAQARPCYAETASKAVRA
ncbi:MAG TPA: hypothetical protein VNJ53_07990 [Gaiellaceae bacterium]|nr:hypothetical protein [Gaiellaceae bacterium]